VGGPDGVNTGPPDQSQRGRHAARLAGPSPAAGASPLARSRWVAPLDGTRSATGTGTRGRPTRRQPPSANRTSHFASPQGGLVYGHASRGSPLHCQWTDESGRIRSRDLDAGGRRNWTQAPTRTGHLPAASSGVARSTAREQRVPLRVVGVRHSGHLGDQPPRTGEVRSGARGSPGLGASAHVEDGDWR
jgi:hypothetical protein